MRLGSLNPTEMKKVALDWLAQRAQDPMKAMPQHFYSETAYALELEHIWRPSWLMAGYSLDIPNPGDYMLYKVENHETVIVRDEDGSLKAYANVCRHRGMRLCHEQQGRLKGQIVCPYHQWSFGVKDGCVRNAPHLTPKELAAAQALQTVHVREMCGLVYINLANSSNKNPCHTQSNLKDPLYHTPLYHFEEGEGPISAKLGSHNLANCKSAKRMVYVVNANWKIVYENNRECYHCVGNHPEYCKATYDTNLIYEPNEGGERKIGGQRMVDPRTRADRRNEIDQQVKEKEQLWKEHLKEDVTVGSAFGGSGWFRVGRLPNRKGFMVESIDGQPVVSKPMGPNFDQLQDGGSLRLNTLPNFWFSASSDHAVGAQLTPLSPTQTRVQVDWLVNKDAVEGTDYNLNQMLPFWTLTNEQDWDICEAVQLGVVQASFVPGPLSQTKESALERFILWYTENLKHRIS
jgi:Rieske 2Fe-2S family protein